MLPNGELNSIRIAVLGTVAYVLEGLYILSWPGSMLTHAFINSFIHCFNMIGVIYVDRSLSVHFDKNRFLNWFGILKVIWNRTSGKNGTQPHRYGILTRIPGIQFVCLNATGSEACSAYTSSCQRQTWNPYLYSQEYSVESIPVLTGIQYVFTGKQAYLAWKV